MISNFQNKMMPAKGIKRKTKQRKTPQLYSDRKTKQLYSNRTPYKRKKQLYSNRTPAKRKTKQHHCDRKTKQVYKPAKKNNRLVVRKIAPVL